MAPVRRVGFFGDFIVLHPRTILYVPNIVLNFQVHFWYISTSIVQ